MSVLDEIRKGDASAVIDRIKASGSGIREIAWPGKPEVKVGLRLLSASESRKAKVENQQEFKRDGIDVAVHNLADYRMQEAAHGLWRAIIDLETKKPVFGSAEQLREFCTDDEFAKLVAEYNAFSESEDPNIEDLSKEDFEALLSLLKKTPDRIPSRVTSLRTAWRLLRTLAVPQAN
jgi:hypothetical protein